MEIDVTDYVQGYDCEQLSSSIAESGLENIGEITWRNAMIHVAVQPLVKPDQQDALRQWIGELGAWDETEIAAMSDQETNALLLQFVAGDVREMEAYADLEEWGQACHDGQASGRLYPGDDDRWYFYVGS